jgi:hypothetical protein
MIYYLFLSNTNSNVYSANTDNIFNFFNKEEIKDTFIHNMSNELK